MPVSVSSVTRLPYLPIATLLLATGFTGCATPTSSSRAASLPARPAAMPAIATRPSARAEHPLRAHWIPVVRYGRYTLVELSPSADQRNLLDQIMDITMPAGSVTSVGDAVRYLLRQSGFRFCGSPQIRILNALPLPPPDRHLGPLTLERALRTLVGPPWKLMVNDVTRRICFKLPSRHRHAGRANRDHGETGSRPADPSDATAVPRTHRP